MFSFKDFVLQEGVDDPGIFKAVFLAGGPGSGKTFVASRTIPNAIFGLKFVNSDQQLEFLLKRAKLSSDMINMSSDELEKFATMRDVAKKLTDKKQKLYLQGRLGMIIDGTGRDFVKIVQQRQELRQYGYDTFMVFVNTSLKVALERNLMRERKVDEKLVKKFWHDVQDNIGKFQNAFGSSNFIVVDNNRANEDLLLKVFKEVRKFVSRSPTSLIAKKWIKLQKGVR